MPQQISSHANKNTWKGLSRNFLFTIIMCVNKYKRRINSTGKAGDLKQQTLPHNTQNYKTLNQLNYRVVVCPVVLGTFKLSGYCNQERI